MITKTCSSTEGWHSKEATHILSLNDTVCLDNQLQQKYDFLKFSRFELDNWVTLIK